MKKYELTTADRVLLHVRMSLCCFSRGPVCGGSEGVTTGDPGGLQLGLHPPPILLQTVYPPSSGAHAGTLFVRKSYLSSVKWLWDAQSTKKLGTKLHKTAELQLDLKAGVSSFEMSIET